MTPTNINKPGRAKGPYPHRQVGPPRRESGGVDDGYEIYGVSKTITPIESGVLPVSYVQFPRIEPTQLLPILIVAVKLNGMSSRYVRTVSQSTCNNRPMYLNKFASTKRVLDFCMRRKQRTRMAVGYKRYSESQKPPIERKLLSVITCSSPRDGMGNENTQ